MLKIGSIWKERDGRFDRYVKVLGFAPLERVAITTVDANDGRGLTGRTTYAKASAFGRRYTFIREA